MNSVEALDFALHILRNRQRRLTTLGTPESNPTAEAIETLEALRELIAERVPSID